MLWRGVCPAGRLAVTFVYCVEIAKDIAIVAMIKLRRTGIGMRIGNQSIFIYDKKNLPKLSNGTTFNDLERPPQPNFKVTTLFDAEYLRNGTR